MSGFETIADVWRNNHYPGVARLTKLVKDKYPNKYIRRPRIMKLFYQNKQPARLSWKKKSKPKGKMDANLVNEQWQMNIFDLSRYEKTK